MIRRNGFDFRSLVLYPRDCSRQRGQTLSVTGVSVSAVYTQMHTAIMHRSGHFPNPSPTPRSTREFLCTRTRNSLQPTRMQQSGSKVRDHPNEYRVEFTTPSQFIATIGTAASECLVWPRQTVDSFPHSTLNWLFAHIGLSRRARWARKFIL